MEIIQSIQNRIYTIRGLRVMLDYDLAQLYEVLTKALNQAVKRNLTRFPQDFMFRLTREEWDNLRSQMVTVSTLNDMRSQIVTSSPDRRHIDLTPYAFREQGVAMLSAVLRSDKAVQMNIAIMRAFVEMRRILTDQTEVMIQLNELKNRVGEHDGQLNAIFEAQENLLDKDAAQRKWEGRTRIGFNRQ